MCIKSEFVTRVVIPVRFFVQFDSYWLVITSGEVDCRRPQFFFHNLTDSPFNALSYAIVFARSGLSSSQFGLRFATPMRTRGSLFPFSRKKQTVKLPFL